MHLILIIIHYLNKMYPILKLIYLQFLPHNQYIASYIFTHVFSISFY